ncbi:MAG: proline--tRNA ligase [Rickettsiaceae bacterium]|nr:proline--tRNA ligase [Rickettsiaceae bacterium]
MRLSQYFLPLIKESPSEAQIISHKLMLRSGMIKQLSAGIYSWLPLGLSVLKNIEKIIRKNLNEAGCVELLMPCIQPAGLWHESGRFDAYGPEMLKIKDRHEADLLFSPTNEELISDIFRSCIKSYKDLPKNLYQIQWKFRDEIRPRFGVLRGREFLMKDLYSFDLTKEDAMKSYDIVFEAYCKIFRDMGLQAIPVRADSGPIGGDLNHEFHILADTGESTIFYDKRFETLFQKSEIDIAEFKGLYAAASEMHNSENSEIKSIEIEQKKGIEVGHIFYFGTKYSKPMEAYVNDRNGNLVPVEMGSYGIGISRLVAAIIEASHDDAGIIWPEAVAPFKVAVINLATNDENCTKHSLEVYNQLRKSGIDVILDDTDQRPGSKFATADLIGTPWHIIIGKNKIQNGIIELKERKAGKIEDMEISVAVSKLMALFNGS